MALFEATVVVVVNIDVVVVSLLVVTDHILFSCGHVALIVVTGHIIITCGQ